jgi:hypothetical protein
MSAGTTPVHVRRLDLDVRVDPARPDSVQVQVLVDGTNPFAGVAPDWAGFDPDDLLGDEPVLLPRSPWRRVALARCTCGIKACGVIAPLLVERDGAITWSDFRDVAGAFVGPEPPDEQARRGSRWQIGTIRFDAGQYRAEIARASADRSWESRRRATARLLRPVVERLVAAAAPHLELVSLRPSWWTDGLDLTLQHAGTTSVSRWQYLRLPVAGLEPAGEADRLGAELALSDPRSWSARYGYDAAAEHRRRREQRPPPGS